MRLTRVIGALVVAQVLASGLSAAYAAKRKPKHAPQQYPKTIETYAATEDEISGSAAAPVPAPKAVLKGPKIIKGPGFDPVPADQVDPLSKRLKLVDELIRRHGRAYDYRVLTVRELENILAKLDAAAAPAQITEPVAPVADGREPQPVPAPVPIEPSN